MKSTTWVEISRSALLENVRQFRALLRPAAVLPIIKSNAYGHGILEVARIVSREKIWAVGVASATEALALRNDGFKKKIVVLNWFEKSQSGALVKNDIDCAVYDSAQAKTLNAAAKRLGRIAQIHLKYDSGTTRLGLYDDALIQLARSCNKLSHVKIVGVFSHFAESESKQKTFTELQLKRFTAVANTLELSGFKLFRHIACTAASIRFANARADGARIGIGLYGLWPSQVTRAATHKLKLQPVLSWRTSVIQVKTVPAHTPVGYGRSYTTKKRSVIAVLPVGYWDGFARQLSNKGSVLVNGTRCPIRGRVCMNLTMIDVSNAGRVTPGTVVTLIGKQGSGTVTADDMARDSGTINYEVVTRINPLIPRVVTP